MRGLDRFEREVLENACGPGTPTAGEAPWPPDQEAAYDRLIARGLAIETSHDEVVEEYVDAAGQHHIEVFRSFWLEATSLGREVLAIVRELERLHANG